VTLESLLDEMTSFDAATYYPDYTCRQQSSYDRRSVTPSNMNWFANDDGGGFIRTETIDGRTEKFFSKLPVQEQLPESGQQLAIFLVKFVSILMAVQYQIGKFLRIIYYNSVYLSEVDYANYISTML